MSHVSHDKRIYVDENKYVSAKVQQTHPRVHSVKKKQVFGELKNVMHNQIGVTPLKGASGELTNRGNNKYNDAGCPTSNHISCKPIDTEYNNQLAIDTIDPVELFDSFDFPKVCCTSVCHKSIEEIWAENNQLDDVALMKAMMKIRNGLNDCDDDEEESLIKKKLVEEEQRYQREEEEIDKLLKESINRQLYLQDNDNDEEYSPCAPKMPEFDIFTDCVC